MQRDIRQNTSQPEAIQNRTLGKKSLENIAEMRKVTWHMFQKTLLRQL